MPSPDGYQRIVIWQPGTGFAVDLNHRHVLSATTPVISEEFFEAGNGSDYAIRRNREFDCQIIDDTRINHLKIMKQLGCPIRMAAIGFKKTVLWLDETAFNLWPERRGTRSFAAHHLRLANDIFYAQINDAVNLLDAFPWYGASWVVDGADYNLISPDAINPDFFWKAIAPAAAPTNTGGNVQISDGDLQIVFEFPAGGATVLLNAPGEHAGATIEALDWDDNVLGSEVVNTNFLLPAITHKIRITLTTDVAVMDMDVPRPTLEVVYSGWGLAPREGTYVACEPTGGTSTPAANPGWAVAIPDYNGPAGGEAPEPEPEPQYVFVASGLNTDLYRGPIAGGEALTNIATLSARPEAMTADTANGWLYYTLYTAMEIRRISFDGITDELVYTVVGENPRGLWYDGDSGYLYYTTGNNNINRVLTDGTGHENIYSGRSNPYGIEFDPAGSVLYWTLTGFGGVEKGPVPAGTVTTVIGSGTDYIYVALDIPNGKVYYAHGSDYFQANLDGTSAVLYKDLTFSSDAGGMRILNGEFWWIDNESTARHISKQNVDGSSVVEIFGHADIPHDMVRLTLG